MNTRSLSTVDTKHRRMFISAGQTLLFTALLCIATMAGALPIPGTPVPITLQTGVLMLAALMLTWRQATAAVLGYLALGACGLPVFAGGMSTAALVGPSAGFLFSFVPAVAVTALLKGDANLDSPSRAIRTAARYFLASLIGCVGLVYLIGILVQSAITTVPLGTIAVASTGFIIGDLIKAAVASLVATGLARLR